MGAAAIISLIGAAGPPIISLIEKIFGPKTGTQKLATATTSFQGILEALLANGKVPQGQMPTTDEIMAAINALVAAMNSNNQLPPSTATDPAGKALASGTKLTITGTVQVQQ